MHADVRALRKVTLDLAKQVTDLGEHSLGADAELAKQIFGVLVVQELICEKLGITADDRKAAIEARETAIQEQERLWREKGEALREEKLAEDAQMRAEAATAGTTEPTEDAGGEAPAQGQDQPDQ